MADVQISVTITIPGALVPLIEQNIATQAGRQATIPPSTDAYDVIPKPVTLPTVEEWVTAFIQDQAKARIRQIAQQRFNDLTAKMISATPEQMVEITSEITALSTFLRQ